MESILPAAESTCPEYIKFFFLVRLGVFCFFLLSSGWIYHSFQRPVSTRCNIFIPSIEKLVEPLSVGLLNATVERLCIVVVKSYFGLCADGLVASHF